MSKKPSRAPKNPAALGEDFNIFPDLDDSEKQGGFNTAAQMDQPRRGNNGKTLATSTQFQKKIAKIPKIKWERYQIAGGIALGIISGICITALNRIAGMPFFIPVLIALTLAIYGPIWFEKKADRPIPKTFIAVMITAIVWFGLYMLYRIVLAPAIFGSAA